MIVMSEAQHQIPTAYSTPTRYSPPNEITNPFDSSSENPLQMISRSTKTSNNSRGSSSELDIAQISVSPVPTKQDLSAYQSSLQRQWGDYSLTEFPAEFMNTNVTNKRSSYASEELEGYYTRNDVINPYHNTDCIPNTNNGLLELIKVQPSAQFNQFYNSNIYQDYSNFQASYMAAQQAHYFNQAIAKQNEYAQQLYSAYQRPTHFDFQPLQDYTGYPQSEKHHETMNKASLTVNQDFRTNYLENAALNRGVWNENSCQNIIETGLLRSEGFSKRASATQKTMQKAKRLRMISSDSSRISNDSSNLSAKPGVDTTELIRILPETPKRGASLWLENDPILFKSFCVGGIDYRNNSIKLTLKENRVWSHVYPCNTEMIATNSGRRIFPSLSLNVTGLNPYDLYIFYIDMVIMRPHLYKNHLGNWVVAGTADEYPPPSQNHPIIYYQEESPKQGAFWMESGVNLTRAKITNSKEARVDQNMIYVYSMHYYMPRINIARVINGDISQLELTGSYIIPGTQFYTVTAYQNPDVIKVKIKNNPFAKGFRNRQSDLDLLDDNGLFNSSLHAQINSPNQKEECYNNCVGGSSGFSSNQHSTLIKQYSQIENLNSSENFTFSENNTSPNINCLF